jgi:transcriptional regulator with XRE-family HTH domain
MKTIADRIKEGMEIRQLKQIDIVEKTGINKGALSSYLSGKYEPKQNNIYLLAKALNVNEAWLMGYDVTMDRDYNGMFDRMTSSEIYDYCSREGIKLTDFMSALKSKDDIFNVKIKMLFNDLNLENKDRVLAYATKLLDIQKEDEIVLNAAHADGVPTEEEINQANDIMDDDKNWD